MQYYRVHVGLIGFRINNSSKNNNSRCRAGVVRFFFFGGGGIKKFLNVTDEWYCQTSCNDMQHDVIGRPVTDDVNG